MKNNTIEEGLLPYGLGEKIRELRLRKSMGLSQLGSHTGLSAAMLSKLERGKLFPTLPTLLRIAMVFGVGLDYFFTDERKRHVVAVVRKQERLRFPEPAGMGAKLACKTAEPAIGYHFESLDFKANERRLNAYYAEFHGTEEKAPRPHNHPGVEFLYVLQGELKIGIGPEVHSLAPGDAIYFDSAVRHWYQGAGAKDCTALIVTVPGMAS